MVDSQAQFEAFQETAKVVAIAGGIVLSLIGVIYGALVMRVHDLEQKTVTKELFGSHKEHLDTKFEGLERTQELQIKLLKALNRQSRHPMPIEDDE